MPIDELFREVSNKLIVYVGQLAPQIFAWFIILGQFGSKAYYENETIVCAYISRFHTLKISVYMSKA